MLVEDGNSSDPTDSWVSQELDVALNRMRSGESLMKCRFHQSFDYPVVLTGGGGGW